MTATGPALLWIHGGGYVIGSAAQDDELCRRFARELGATVAAVDYRLAPEYPYPTPLEDCYSALHVAGSTCPPSTRRAWPSAAPARAAGWPRRWRCWPATAAKSSLAAQLLVYPMLDDRSVRPEGSRRPRPPAVDAVQSTVTAGPAYLGDADPNVAVPARRDDLSGLPPAWVGVGTFDLFHDEDLAYAERLEAAGVPCEVEVVRGAFHGFDGVVPKAAVSQSFFDSQVRSAAGGVAPHADGTGPAVA